MSVLGATTIIIPIAPGEEAWRDLLGDLKALSAECKIFLVGPRLPSRQEIKAILETKHVETIKSELGRALQLNVGARKGESRFLWFLHADTRVKEEALSKLQESAAAFPYAVHYFKLAYQDDGPLLMFLNSFGATMRSAMFGLPFGDQGVFLSREIFSQIGGFNEEVAYGEDHLFMWQVKKRGIPLRCTGATIYTSARKYREQGWLKTTGEHGILWLRQVLSEMRSSGESKVSV